MTVRVLSHKQHIVPGKKAELKVLVYSSLSLCNPTFDTAEERQPRWHRFPEYWGSNHLNGLTHLQVFLAAQPAYVLAIGNFGGSLT